MVETTQDEYDRCSKSFEYFFKRYMLATRGLTTTTSQEYFIQTYNGGFYVEQMPAQSGKTFLGLSYLLWKALFVPNTLNITLTPQLTNRIHISLLSRQIGRLPDFLKRRIVKRKTYTNVLKFNNGSAIETYTIGSGNPRDIFLYNLRGQKIDALFCDDFNEVHYEEMYNLLINHCGQGRIKDIIFLDREYNSKIVKYQEWCLNNELHIHDTLSKQQRILRKMQLGF